MLLISQLFVQSDDPEGIGHLCKVGVQTVRTFEHRFSSLFADSTSQNLNQLEMLFTASSGHSLPPNECSILRFSLEGSENAAKTLRHRGPKKKNYFEIQKKISFVLNEHDF